MQSGQLLSSRVGALTLVAIVSILSAAPLAAGNEPVRHPSPEPAAVVTASTTVQGIRFAATGDVVRVQIEVISQSGDTLFEVAGKGNVLDWAVVDGAGGTPPDGSYLCVVTVKTLSGRLQQRVVTVVLSAGRPALSRTRGELTEAQREHVGPLEPDSELTIVWPAEPDGAAVGVSAADEDTPSVTLTAHDGDSGQIISTSDTLSFRLGNFFAGQDAEAMTLTRDGLMVEGTFRARGGIVFDDGTALTSSGEKGYVGPDGRIATAPGPMGIAPRTAPRSSATSSTPRISVEGAGGRTFAVFDDGKVGIGTAIPDLQLHVAGNGIRYQNGTKVLDITSGTLSDIVSQNNSLVIASRGEVGDNNIVLNPYANGGTPPFRNGNVGIGNFFPNTKLHVNGDMTLESSSPTLFTGSGTTELSRYLSLINSPAYGSASGLKAGGVLVADAYDFANPSKNSLIVKGSATIGAASGPSGVKLFATGAVVGVQGGGSSQGVRGEGGTYGVYGSGTTYGIYGTCPTPPECYGGWFNGHVRMNGGASVATQLSVGGYVFAEGFEQTSDRGLKTNFADISPRAVLQRVAAMPIRTWSYKSDPQARRHMGPVAQDFRAAFGLGTDDKHIGTVDAAGVSFAAIQGLYQLLEEQQRELATLREEIATLRNGQK